MLSNLWADYKRLFPWMSRVPVIRTYFFGMFCRAYCERLDSLGVFDK